MLPECTSSKSLFCCCVVICKVSQNTLDLHRKDARHWTKKFARLSLLQTVGNYFLNWRYLDFVRMNHAPSTSIVHVITIQLLQ